MEKLIIKTVKIVALVAGACVAATTCVGAGKDVAKAVGELFDEISS